MNWIFDLQFFAHKKGQGSSTNGRDSEGKRLGIKKYAGQADAVKKLSEKVKKGGKGVWGEIPMPPNAAVKDADIETLVKWILAGAK